MEMKSNAIQVGQIQRLNIVAPQRDLFAFSFIEMRRFLQHFLLKNGLNVAIIALLLYIAFGKNLLAFGAQDAVEMSLASAKPVAMKANLKQKNLKQKPMNPTAAVGIVLNDKNTPDTEGVIEVLPTRPMSPVRTTTKSAGGNDANLFDNVSIFIAPERADAAAVKSKQEKCWDYVRRFVNVARSERHKFGIPVSIILAQGLLESDAGDSRLTRSANNHFGIKTFNRRVPHVVMKDDTPTDKFKKYDSAWQSFRDHSLLLMRDHYKDLQYLSKTDYVGWARGLQRAGYATDKQYADKLVKIIENLRLFQLDEA